MLICFSFCFLSFQLVADHCRNALPKKAKSCCVLLCPLRHWSPITQDLVFMSFCSLLFASWCWTSGRPWLHPVHLPATRHFAGTSNVNPCKSDREHENWELVSFCSLLEVSLSSLRWWSPRNHVTAWMKWTTWTKWSQVAIFRVLDQKGPLLALLLDSMNVSFSQETLENCKFTKSEIYHERVLRFALIIGVVALCVARWRWRWWNHLASKLRKWCHWKCNDNEHNDIQWHQLAGVPRCETSN